MYSMLARQAIEKALQETKFKKGNLLEIIHSDIVLVRSNTKIMEQ